MAKSDALRSDVLQGTLDLMILKTSRPWGPCMAGGSRSVFARYPGISCS